MAIILPAAPKNFYDPSLNELKDKLLAVNGSSKGRITLLTAPPIAIDSAWAEVGAAWDTNQGSNRGSLVVGSADIGAINGPVLGPIEAGGEAGYKLQFGKIEDILVYINGSGTATTTVVGIALIEGVDSFALGTNPKVRYIIKVDNLVVTDGKKVTLPEFEIIINFGEIEAGV